MSVTILQAVAGNAVNMGRPLGEDAINDFRSATLRQGLIGGGPAEPGAV